MTINKNFWLLLIFILSGIVIGGLLGQLATQVSYLGWLAYGMNFGTTNPFTLDMGLLNLTFGLTSSTIFNLTLYFLSLKESITFCTLTFPNLISLLFNILELFLNKLKVTKSSIDKLLSTIDIVTSLNLGQTK